MKHVLTITLALAGALALPIQASSQTRQFTFNVNYDLKSMMSAFQVRCNVGINSIFPGSTIGTGTAPLIPLDPGGNGQGTVTVSFDVMPGRDPALATHYECMLLHVGSGLPPSANATPEELRPKDGTPFVPLVNGTL